MNEKFNQLVRALRTGGILFKVHNEIDKEFLFYDGSFQMRGWNTVYGTACDRFVDVFDNPELWEIHEHHFQNGYPYPWSSDYKK